MNLFQMDVYPTILYALNEKLGGWQGWGENLYMVSDSTQREVSASEAQYLSDKMIRMDFFSDNNTKEINESYMYGENYNYIAHAGGVISGLYYTNSMEAVQHALSCGIRYVELDLILSVDSQLVAAHDWEHFNFITSHVGDSALTLEEFKNRKIYGNYTPITWVDIDTLLNNHPDMYLVTDKTSRHDILNKFLWKHRSHVVVECFCMEDYEKLKDEGYICLYSSCPKSKTKIFKRRIKNLLSFSWDLVATNYAFWYLGAPNEIHYIEDYNDGYGDLYAVFSVDNRTKADSIAALDKRIKYVYIDNVE